MLISDVRDDYEIIGGKKFMAPAANTIHNVIGGRLFMFIGTYLDAKELGYCFTDSANIYFPDGNLFQPDFSIVLKENEQMSQSIAERITTKSVTLARKFQSLAVQATIQLKTPPRTSR